MTDGRFGVHGGQYIPETLMNAVLELEEAYLKYKDDPEFNKELEELLNEYAGRPSRLYYAAHMTEDLGGAKMYLKREDLNHTGCSQDQQRTGTGASGQENGQDSVSSQRPEQDSTAWQPRQRQLSWAWNVKCSWVRKIRSVRL